MLHKYSGFITAVILGVVVSACNPARHLTNEQYLLVSNQIEIEPPVQEVENSLLSSLVLQKPNRRLLGVFHFRLWMYNTFRKGWLHREIGEPPSILDHSQTEASRMQMIKYLNNIGYFNSLVSAEILGDKGRKRKVRYNISLSSPYTIRHLHYKIENDTLRKIVLSDSVNTLIKKGHVYNVYVLDEERDRITNYLQDRGYYGFLKDNIIFEVDSAFQSRKLDIAVNLGSFNAKGRETEAGQQGISLKRYKVNNLFIYPDFKPFLPDTAIFDTLEFSLLPYKNKTPQQYRFIFAPPLKINPRIVAQSMFIDSDNFYNLTKVKRTHRRLGDLPIYRFIDIAFREPDTAKLTGGKGYDRLDCHVYLTRAPIHSYSVELQGTNTGGDLGFGAYLTYQNKNIFRGAETFRIRLKGALEAQKYTAIAQETQLGTFSFFNTFESGIDATLLFPKFLLPARQERFSRSFEPKTGINLGYNLQNRPDYIRFLSNLSFGYEWTESKYLQHFFYPADISIIQIDKSLAFDSVLNISNDERLKSQYTDHFITALRYSFVYNNQEITRIKNFIYFKAVVEFSGNLVNLMQKTGGIAVNEDGYRTLFNIRYAQYVRPHLEFRYYYLINRNNSLVFRAYTGLARAYGNSIAVPFEKGYYAGGANGMRGWQLRSLGPGSFSNQGLRIDRVGDLQLEGNAEYRFPVYSFLSGALFLDAGNIWLIQENPTFPGGVFNADTFWKEVALDGGIGIRFNFNFFIIRMDIAHQLRDPARLPGDRWVHDKIRWRTLVWNLGIGYPF